MRVFLGVVGYGMWITHLLTVAGWRLGIGVRGTRYACGLKRVPMSTESGVHQIMIVHGVRLEESANVEH